MEMVRTVQLEGRWKWLGLFSYIVLIYFSIYFEIALALLRSCKPTGGSKTSGFHAKQLVTAVTRNLLWLSVFVVSI